MRYKQTFLFNLTMESKAGIAVVQDYFVNKLGYNNELVRTLIMKYPYVLSKTPEQLDKTIETLKSIGFPQQEVIRLIFECPKLLSIDLQTQMKECFHLFDLYHGITQKQVIGIFKEFPYLFCCDMSKMRQFLAEFRKYRFTNKEIIRLVSNSPQHYFFFSAKNQTVFWLVKSTT